MCVPDLGNRLIGDEETHFFQIHWLLPTASYTKPRNHLPTSLSPTGSSSSQHLISTLPHTSHWSPGRACPVPKCFGIFFKTRQAFRRHWMEQHEQFIEQHSCALCPSTSKRRDNLTKHIRTMHPHIADFNDGIGPVQYQANKHFVDPFPLSRDMVLPSSFSTSLPPVPNSPVLENKYSKSDIAEIWNVFFLVKAHRLMPHHKYE